MEQYGAIDKECRVARTKTLVFILYRTVYRSCAIYFACLPFNLQFLHQPTAPISDKIFPQEAIGRKSRFFFPSVPILSVFNI